MKWKERFRKTGKDMGICTVLVMLGILAMASMAVAAPNGTVWDWGHNGNGQLGDNTTIDRLIPVQVSGLANVIDIVGGGEHSAALKSDGTVWTWGLNEYGQLGDGTTTQRLIPVQVSGLANVIDIVGGGEHSAVLKSDGTVWTWGYNGYGQLGDNTTINRLTPVQVSGLTNVINIAGGYFHSAALKSDGTVWTWGWNGHGQLGDNTTINRLIPVQVSGLANVIDIAGRYEHSAALKSDGTVWTWGYNGYGQLGDNTTINRLIPVQVSGLANVIDIAGGGYHTIALVSISPTSTPNQPTDLTQLKPDGTTAIIVGGTTNERTVKFSANVSDLDGDNVRLQVELRGLNENNGQFNESLGGLKESSLVANGSIATATAVELINGDYHWRARTVDEHGNKSEWVGFGENPTSEADFTVNSQGFEVAVISDIHIGPDIKQCMPSEIKPEWSDKCGTLWINSLADFSSVIEKVNADNPELVIIPGDFVEWNSVTLYQQFVAKLAQLKMPVYIVSGNHDRRGAEIPVSQLDAARPRLNPTENYIEYIGSMSVDGVSGDYLHGNYYFDKFGYRFIALDSGYDPSNLLDVGTDPKLRENPTGSGLSSEQVQFVRDNAIPGKTIVFMHHPTNDIDNNYNVISRNREQLINVELEKNIKVTIGGHTHDFRHFHNPEFSTSDYLSPICGFCDGGLPRNLLVQSRSATKGNPSGYTIVDIGKNQDGEILVRDVKMLGDKIEPGKILSVYSPADLNLYDEYGRHTGPNITGGIDNQIPNSYYIQGAKIGNITLPESVILYNNILNYRTEIVSNFSKENITGNQSHFNFTIEERTGGAIKTTSYNNVTIEANSRAYLENSSQSVQVDINNDGTNETVKTPDSVVINYAPIAAITSPANSSTWDQGQEISFSGTGTDPEDGTLNDLVWISDRDDVIGHGSFSTTNLSAGVHHITLRVNDSTGQVNTSTTVLTVRDTIPPNVLMDYPTENKIFNHPNITVQGIAYDDSGIANVTVNGIQAGQENWNASITLSEGENIIEVAATDNAGFSKTANRTVYYNSSLASDTTPPSAITNLAYTTGYDNATGAWINWTWTNPSDADFSHAIVYLDNIPMGNTSRPYMNFTGLSSEANYNISIKTADIVDNVNEAEVSGTARTPAETPPLPLPEIRYINGTVMDSITKTGIAGATVSTNISNSTAADSLGFYSLSVPEGEYILTVKLDPMYYVNDTIQVSTIGVAVVEQDIELQIKPTGNITGSVWN